MDKQASIYIAGHKGLVGAAIVRRLKLSGYNNLITRTHKELDITRQDQTESFFNETKPDFVFLAAARVGGIIGNSTYPANFIYDNLAIQANVIHTSYINKVKKLLFLGSSCIYPRNCSQPMREEHLLSGYLEPTNEPYAVAKIAGIKMCQSYNRQYGTQYISIMPTNLYGPHDNFDLETSHVLPAFIRKFHEAKTEGKSEVEIWGTGTPKRELLHVDDLAEACLFLMNNYNESEIINVGSGIDITIKELAEKTASITGYRGKLCFDTSKPDGTPLKLLDISKIKSLGWQASIELDDGIRNTYQWYKENLDKL
ncbi:MAG: GDP-L-fucose synthase [Deltaproteobacteria bacterium]|nr:GDP-L-fucose synthase [Deltaproteobacteria bacterium]